MVNLRCKSKGKAVAPRVALKAKPTVPTPPDNVSLSEETLRKLPRAELQKLAMVSAARSRAMRRVLTFPRPTK